MVKIGDKVRVLDNPNIVTVVDILHGIVTLDDFVYGHRSWSVDSVKKVESTETDRMYWEELSNLLGWRLDAYTLQHGATYSRVNPNIREDYPEQRISLNIGSVMRDDIVNFLTKCIYESTVA